MGSRGVAKAKAWEGGHGDGVATAMRGREGRPPYRRLAGSTLVAFPQQTAGLRRICWRIGGGTEVPAANSETRVVRQRRQATHACHIPLPLTSRMLRPTGADVAELASRATATASGGTALTSDHNDALFVAAVAVDLDKQPATVPLAGATRGGGTCTRGGGGDACAGWLCFAERRAGLGAPSGATDRPER